MDVEIVAEQCRVLGRWVDREMRHGWLDSYDDQVVPPKQRVFTRPIVFGVNTSAKELGVCSASRRRWER